MMHREKPRAPSTDGLSAHRFSDAFADKMNRVRLAAAAEASSQHVAVAEIWCISNAK